MQGMDETQIANRLADLGALITGSVDMDRASVGLRTLSAADKRTPALDILRTVLISPQFPPAVIEREKARSIVAIKESLTRPATIAGNAFWSAMYPAHPYGRQPTVESIASLERADLENQRKRVARDIEQARKFAEAVHKAHPGISRMTSVARAYVYWPGLDKCIKDLVNRCGQCQLAEKAPVKSLLSSWATPTAPWERVLDYYIHRV